MPHRLFLADSVPAELDAVVHAVQAEAPRLRSDEIRHVPDVLDLLRPHLDESGWALSTGARRKHGIALRTTSGPPVLADGVHQAGRAAFWAETGRSWANNGYLEHLVRPAACADVDHVAIAVREVYNGPAYARIIEVVEQLASSGRLGLPYKSLLLISF